MDNFTRYRYYLDSLCVFDFEDDEVIEALYDLLHCDDEEEIISLQAAFFKSLKSSTLKQHISALILHNENSFSKACCARSLDRLPVSVVDAARQDLKKLEALSNIKPKDVTDWVDDDEVREILIGMPWWETGKAEAPLMEKWDGQLDALEEYYLKNGYGVFSSHLAFKYIDEELIPIRSVDPIRLTDLKNYELQRQQVVDNTESFINGLPANNVLLYGDRGTGKSSTVHALLNEYYSKGLRMIEMTKYELENLTALREELADSPLKFIIYIDDLSFDSGDTTFNNLKAALEGSLSGRQDNVLIYATSNRRHLIKESFTDRDNDVHASDIIQEQLSLSDRFGLTVTFVNPNKRDYLDIVEKIAADRDMGEYDIEKLLLAAERWATKRGGRSPRTAKQFIDHIEACLKSGKDW